MEEKKKTSTKTTSKKKTTTKKVSTTKTTKKKTVPIKEAPTTKKILETQQIDVTNQIEEEIETPKEEKRKSDNFKMAPTNIFIAVLACLLIGIYSVTLFLETKENNYSSKWDGLSYLVEKQYAKEVNCTNIPVVISDDISFIYIQSFDEENYEKEFELEKSLKKIIEEYGLKDNFYVYPSNSNCGSLADLGSTSAQSLKLTKPITKVPTILFYKNGVLIDYIERIDNQMMDESDFVQLLDIYEIKK